MGIVGRGRVQAALCTAVDELWSGGGRLVLLAGEPGIGKSAVAAEVIEYARQRGAVIVAGSCWEGDGVPAFWPWRRALAGLSDATLTVDLLDHAVGAADAADARFRVFGAVTKALETVAALQPVVVFIDDLHWADPASLRLLRFVTRQLRSSPLMLIAAYRDIDPAPSDALREFLADAVGETFTLGGLHASEVAELMSSQSGSVLPETVATVHRRTGGNPFFVMETVRLMAASDSGLAAVPAAVRDAIARRLDHLPAPSVETLSAAAILGASMARELLADVVGRSVDDDIAAATAARILRVDGEIVTFEHDLFRETIAARLAAGEARRWHAGAADALIRSHAANTEIAHHCVQSLPDGDVDAAVDFSVAAARDATIALAYEEATGHLRRAMRIAPVPLNVTLDFADAARRSGDYVEARTAYLSAAAAATDANLVARAALGLHHLGTASEGSHRDVIDLLEGSVVEVSEDAPHARVLGALARELADGPDQDRERAAALAERAVEIARRSNARDVLAFCLFALHDVIWAPGTATRRLQLADEMTAAAGDDMELAFEAAFCRMIALLDVGDARFEVALADMARIADRSRLPKQRFYVTSRRAMVAIMRGNDEEAHALVDEAEAIGAMIGHPDTFGLRVTQLLLMGLAREGAVAARRLEERYGMIAPAEFEPEMRALVALANEKLELAAATLRASEPPLARARFRWRALSAVAFDAEIAVQSGAIDLCRQLYETLRPYENEVAAIGGAAVVMGPVPYYQGLLAQALGRSRDAERHFAQALDVAQRLGAVPLIERIRAIRPAAVFRRDGDVWTLTFAGSTVRMPDSKGLGDIAMLLAAPGTAISAAELAGLPAAGADPILDDAARSAYQRRLAVIDEALDRATEADRTSWQDERDALIDELTRAAGLGGRGRRLDDTGERARTAVTARIRDAIRKIAERNPPLATHLQQAIVTGRRCSYRPTEPVRWSL